MGSSGRRRRGLRRTVAALSLCAAIPLIGRAQAPADTGGAERPATLPDGTRRVSGRVVTPRDSALGPVQGTWVTLHRVAGDAAGPLDSVRSGADGRYAFTYRPRGASDAIYFVSTTYGGIAYFSSPLREAVVSGDRGEITVFDTTSARVPVTVRGRHVAVGRAGPDGSHEILDVYELSNDGARTAVPGSGPDGVWSAPLPAGATAFAVRAGGDVPTDGMTGTNGRAVLRAPLAPGIKQVAFSYRLAPDRFPLSVSVGGATSVLEVLIEDPTGTAKGAGVVAAAPVMVEGHAFHRFLAQDVAAGARVTVDVPTPPGDIWPRWAVPALIAGVGGTMAIGLLAGTARRRTRAPAIDAAPRPGLAA